tara:strand:+ start:6951 stop:7442 length:492 start_codon:yes stop_codon:yes gene_type:complete
MASFDVVSKIDLQEVDNAVNSVKRELSNRYDFKGANFTIEIDQKDKKINIHAPDDYKLGQIGDSIKAYCVKRGIDVKALVFKDKQEATGNSLRQEINLRDGIEQDTAKKIIKDIKAQKIKVQASIRGDELRVEGKKRDDLQQVMSSIKSGGYDAALQFINFRD